MPVRKSPPWNQGSRCDRYPARWHASSRLWGGIFIITITLSLLIVLGQAHLGSGAFCENLKTMSHICLPVLTSGKKDSNWCLQEKKLNKEISSLWISTTYKFPHSESLLGIPSAFHTEQSPHTSSFENYLENHLKKIETSHPLWVTIQVQSCLGKDNHFYYMIMNEQVKIS